jgi:murein DD-endopeptidase MepM/ murein hydrolase activator NlpD
MTTFQNSRAKPFAIFGLLAFAALFVGVAVAFRLGSCGGYADWKTSPYVLPYPVGKTYPLYQGNCTLGGHRAGYRYSYDFLMPIGALVTAARAGVVSEVLDGYQDGNNGTENWVKVRHADGSIAAYSHLHSVLVRVGEEVRAGSPIGLSGNTGQTGGVPHLHFQVAPCSEPIRCGTLPITFRNTAPNPDGLQYNQNYTAEAYTP